MDTDLNQEMGDILRRVGTIAVVGASDKTHRASYGVMQFLLTGIQR